MVSILLLYVLTSPLHGYNIAYAFMILPWLAFLPGINIATIHSIKHLNIGETMINDFFSDVLIFPIFSYSLSKYSFVPPISSSFVLV